MIKYILPTLALGSNNKPHILRIPFQFFIVFLLFLMGMLFALDEKVTTKMKAAGLKVLVFPFAVALGSLKAGLSAA